jgi:predicted TIM-barrel fold metal-dependent hydrolase
MSEQFNFVPSREVSRIRGRLDHPIVDGDGHLLEFMPLVFDLVREIADDGVARRLADDMRQAPSARSGFLPVRVFFGLPERNTLDRMTVALPELLYRRLDEIGLDFALLYPSAGLTMLGNPDAELRQAAARALNTYFAEAYAEYRDWLEPVAVIPTFTPEEAVAELDYAIGTLGLKAVVMTGVIPRSVRADGTPAAWVDTLGHGSLYDYDPVWAKCLAPGVVPAFHGIGYGWGSRVSATNYVHNHLGSFAAAQEAVCRSLIMGSVMRRFPDLRVFLLEGGIGWAAQLYADLLSHYEKRNRERSLPALRTSSTSSPASSASAARRTTPSTRWPSTLACFRTRPGSAPCLPQTLAIGTCPTCGMCFLRHGSW